MLKHTVGHELSKVTLICFES